MGTLQRCGDLLVACGRCSGGEGRGEEAGTRGAGRLGLPCRRLLLKGSCLDQQLGVDRGSEWWWCWGEEPHELPQGLQD